MCLAQVAVAQSTPEPGAAAVDAYVEPAPTGPGVSQYLELVPSGGGSSTRGTQDTKRADARAGGPSISRALRVILQSPSYGAPPPPGQRQRDNSAGRVNEVPMTTSLGTSIESSIGALATVSDTRLIALLAVILATTVGSIVIATRRGSG